jgi:hypothetical protein
MSWFGKRRRERDGAPVVDERLEIYTRERVIVEDAQVCQRRVSCVHGRVSLEEVLRGRVRVQLTQDHHDPRSSTPLGERWSESPPPMTSMKNCELFSRSSESATVLAPSESSVLAPIPDDRQM